MSKLRRMELCGLRSFGPDDEDRQSIRFHSPLTLIKGQNGCGKTTIIEALKFAVTGVLPSGSDSGQSFVYDPKLAGVIECRGQVKLQVCDVKGDSVTVSKKVCVVQKAKDKQEFRRLDSVISRGKREERSHVSQKCVDVDQEMCLLLGVSKSVLNNVIFCHQEDSNWPLDEPKKLKEKFDDIFDATKYNKCSEQFTKYKKLIDNKVVLLKNQHDHLRERKARVEEQKNVLRDKIEKLEAVDSKIESVNVKFEPIAKRIKEIHVIEENYRKLLNVTDIRKSELSSLQKQQEEILQGVTEFLGTDEELQNKLKSFESDLSKTTDKINKVEQEKNLVVRNENTLRSQINEQERKLGQIEAEEKQNTSRIKNRNQLMNAYGNDFQVTIPEMCSDSSESDVNLAIINFEEKYDESKTKIVKLEHEFQDDEKRLQNEIDQFRENQIQLKENLSSKNKQLRDLKEEVREVEHNIQELNTADDQLKLVESKLQRLDRESQGLESSVDVTSLKSEIEFEKEKVTKLDSRLTVVDNEIQTLQHYSSLQTELDILNETSINKQNSLQKLKNKHEKALSQIFPSGLPSSELKFAMESYHRNQIKLVKSLTNQISEKQTEVTKFEANLSAKREKLKELEEVVASSKKELYKYCKDESLEEVIQATNKTIEKLQKEKGVYSSSTYMYQKFIQEFEKKEPCCPVCKRNVEEETYVKVIIKDLSDKIKNFPSEQRKIENQLREKQEEYKKLFELKPMYRQMEKYVKTDIPALQSELKNIESTLQESMDELTDLQISIVDPQSNETLCNNIMGDVTLMDQYGKDLTSTKQEITSLSSRIPQHESLRTIQEALAEQDSLKIDLRTSRNQLESLRTKLSQYNERVQKHREKYNELVTQQLSIKKNLQDKDHFFTKRSELEIKISQLQNELSDLELQLSPLTQKLQTAMRKKEETVARNKKQLEQSRARINEMKKQLDIIHGIQAYIKEFNQKNFSQQRSLTNETIASYKNELKTCSDKKSTLEKEMDELKILVTNSKVYRRELLDNIQLREKRKQISKLKLEIQELNEKLGSNNINEIQREYNDLTRKQDSLRELKSKEEGKREELKDRISDIKKELSKPENVNAALDFKKKFLEMALHERSARDLKEFVKAIDCAMMSFHTQKMIQINHTIRDLWRSIYRGNDCDYIEIKTEDAQKGYNDKRKTFNYYVVQIKNGVEMRMRGRCSAGQRVLASLIIRIALAETFSVNCGILALDEPTTNLDRENIISLSETIVDLIGQKRLQNNFQLLVITHDQDFVDKLTRVENMEAYYVVERNQYGKSVISAHRI